MMGRCIVRVPELVQVGSAGVDKTRLHSAEQHVCLRTLAVLGVRAWPRPAGAMMDELSGRGGWLHHPVITHAPFWSSCI